MLLEMRECEYIELVGGFVTTVHPKQCNMNIAWKELYGILVEVHAWSILWPKQKYSLTVITKQ